MGLMTSLLTIKNILIPTGEITADKLNSGTAGSVLTGDGTKFVESAAGTSGQFLQSNGASAPTWASSTGGTWTPLETLSISGATVTTSGTLGAYDEYRIVGHIASDDATVRLTRLQMNTDTGANYAHRTIQGTTVTDTSGDGHISLAQHNNTTPANVDITIQGLTEAITNGKLAVCGSAFGALANLSFLGGYWIGGNATQITTFTIESSAASSGEFEIYGRNFA